MLEDLELGLLLLVELRAHALGTATLRLGITSVDPVALAAS